MAHCLLERTKKMLLWTAVHSMRILPDQISIGVANARLYAKMNDMAIRDGLTRIYNRRHLTELLRKYLAKAMAKKSAGFTCTF